MSTKWSPVTDFLFCLLQTFMSSTESTATPAIPTSPSARGLSESYLDRRIGRREKEGGRQEEGEGRGGKERRGERRVREKGWGGKKEQREREGGGGGGGRGGRGGGEGREEGGEWSVKDQKR